jgi:hypothetical protein
MCNNNYALYCIYFLLQHGGEPFFAAILGAPIIFWGELANFGLEGLPILVWGTAFGGGPDFAWQALSLPQNLPTPWLSRSHWVGSVIPSGDPPGAFRRTWLWVRLKLCQDNFLFDQQSTDLTFHKALSPCSLVKDSHGSTLSVASEVLIHP